MFPPEFFELYTSNGAIWAVVYFELAFSSFFYFRFPIENRIENATFLDGLVDMLPQEIFYYTLQNFKWLHLGAFDIKISTLTSFLKSAFSDGHLPRLA